MRILFLAGAVTVAITVSVLAQTSIASTKSPAGEQSSVTPMSLATPRYGTWGFDTSAMDPAVRPGDDFNSYANGNWIRNTVIPADRVSVGLFSNLRNLGDGRVYAILENAASGHAPADTPEGKIGALYRAFMDERTVEARGSDPLKAGLKVVRAVRTRDDLAEVMGRELDGFSASIFDIDITSDAKNPSRNAVYLNQSGLGLPDRDYYLQPQYASKTAAYQAYAAQLLELAGWPDAQTQASAIVAFETQIAQVSWTHAEERDEDKTYNPTTIAALQRGSPGFAWPRFLKAASLSRITRLVITSNTSLPRIAFIYAATPLETLKAWEAFRTTDSAAPYLSGPFVKAQFDFRSHVLAGQMQLPARSKRAVTSVNDMLGSAVGKIYVATYFSPETDGQVNDLVGNLKTALRERIDALNWMDSTTKLDALRKLANLEIQVGYPKVWRDYSGLEIKADDLYGDIVRGKELDWQRRVHGLDQPWDKSAWRFWPQYATAYTENGQLIFTAGIARPPFFDPKADPAINYGALGAVIGHELTHSFDDQGRKEDAEGRLRAWWTAADVMRFKERAQRLSVQYSAMQPLPGLHIKGDVTLGENIADLGGLTIALAAYHASLKGKPAPVIDGYTGDQRLFLGWAQVWRGKCRDDDVRKQVASDLHSPNQERINGVVRNMDEWYAAYAVKAAQALYLAPADRVHIW